MPGPECSVAPGRDFSVDLGESRAALSAARYRGQPCGYGPNGDGSRASMQLARALAASGRTP
jgi:hypothetical protein